MPTVTQDIVDLAFGRAFAFARRHGQALAQLTVIRGELPSASARPLLNACVRGALACYAVCEIQPRRAMTDAASRLKEARSAAGFKSASRAARAHRWPLSTYLGHENGSRGIHRHAAKNYAQAYRVDVAWLLYGGDNPGRTVETLPTNQLSLRVLASALEEAEARVSALPYKVTFEIDGPLGALLARGVLTNGMQVHSATTGRPLVDVLANPHLEFNYMLGFLEASLGTKAA